MIFSHPIHFPTVGTERHRMNVKRSNQQQTTTGTTNDDG
jgi:hypothetical protein